MAAKKEGRNPDDLTRIEGIGPKTRDFLLAQGIRTFAALSKRTANDLRELLDQALGRVATRDPATWPEQARLASLGNWNSLEQLQERLQHGVEVPPAPDREVLYVDTGRSPTRARPYPIFRLPPAQEIDREFQERYDELERQRERVDRACAKLRPALENGRFGPFVSCGPDLHTKWGRTSSPLRYVISVAVPYKITEFVLRGRPFDSLPRVFEGHQLKVVESRPFLLSQGRGRLLRGTLTPPNTIYPASASSLEQTELVGGLPCCVEGEEDNWGTLGVCLKHNGNFVGIVNAHFASRGDSMVQPPVNPLDPAQSADMGRVMRSVAISAAPDPGTVDAAIVKLADSSRSPQLKILSDLGSGELLDQPVYILKDRFPVGSRHHVNGLPVLKVGARTGKTTGRVDKTNYSGLRIGNRLVKNVIRFKSYGPGTIVDDGDSGSALLARIRVANQDALLVIGLVFAGDAAQKYVGYACHLGDVISKLNLNVSNALSLGSGDWSFNRERM